MPTRREFLTAAGLFGAIVLIDACVPKRPGNPTLTPPPSRTPEPMKADVVEKKLGIQFDENSWHATPAITRIQRLQTGQYFDVEQLQGDKRKKEMAGALAEFYCQQTPCVQTPEDLAKSVSFVDPNEFMREVNLDAQGMMTDKRKTSLETTGVYYVTQGGKIFVNKDQILTNSMVLAAENTGDLDTPDLYEREVILAAYSEATMAHESFDIPPTEFDINNKTDKTTFIFNRMEGFDLIGTQDGRPVSVQGLKTVVAQYEAYDLITRLNMDTGIAYQSPNPYQVDIAFLDKILKEGDIGYKIFVGIAQGRASIQKDLLPALGVARNMNQTPTEAAVAKLTALGLAGEGYIPAK